MTGASVQGVRWLFFDLGNTLVSEEAAAACRIERLVKALARCGRHYSTGEVRLAFEKAWAQFAPRPFLAVIEQLVDGPASRRAVATEAPYPKNWRFSMPRPRRCFDGFLLSTGSA
jgi:hypothetical protein